MTTAREYEEYIKRLKSPDLQDDNVFHELVAYGMRLTGLLDEEAARHFSVSRTTVMRWKTGANAPHPALRKHVYALLRSRASKLLKQEMAPAAG